MTSRDQFSFVLSGLSAIIDILVIRLCFDLAFHTRNFLALHPAGHEVVYSDYETFSIYVVLLTLMFLKVCGTYECLHTPGGEGPGFRVAAATAYACVAMMAVTFVFKGYDLSRLIFLVHSLLAFFFLTMARHSTLWVRRRLHCAGFGIHRAIVVGTPGQATPILERLMNPEHGLSMAGFVAPDRGLDTGSAAPDDEPAQANSQGKPVPGAGYPILGRIQDLPDIIRGGGIDEIYFAPRSATTEEIFKTRLLCARFGVAISFIPDTDESMVPTATEVRFFDGLMAIEILKRESRGPYLAVKRGMDLFIGGTAFLFSLPVMAMAALAVAILDGRPVLFSQQRVGKGGELFTIYKFRTMRRDAPTYSDSPIETSDDRITPLGRILRRLSIDELPQLFNVLKGDMSLVGPRPEMPYIVETYSDLHRRRLDVTPGLTGLWQVYGRHHRERIHEHIKYDLHYVENQSLFLDLRILFATIPAVIFGRGAV